MWWWEEAYNRGGFGLEGGHLLEDELEQSVDNGLLLLLERLVASVQHVVGVHWIDDTTRHVSGAHTHASATDRAPAEGVVGALPLGKW
jgi:hypothetical protein